MSRKRKKNKLIVIGFCGAKFCYLNITEDEALERYILTEGQIDKLETPEDYKKEGYMKIYEFKDEFQAYDIYG